ncbi:MAG: hypothetical protein HY898_03540 [Deltaproteobacteria bacterium]|nr:hypothetical protein [Deltaproteobacteria bacterium]
MLAAPSQTQPANHPARSSAPAASTAPAAAPSASGTAADASAPSATPDAAPEAAADAAADAIDWKNKAKPELTSAELDAHAKALLEAIAKDDPEIGRDFFFPREPFKPLKDVADADRYWVQLYGTYKRDVHELHRKRRDWTGAAFESFALGTPPTWVKPGDEYNKIGYYRTFRGRLRYTVGDKKGHIDVHTIISWNGQWYITHLAPIKH